MTDKDKMVEKVSKEYNITAGGFKQALSLIYDLTIAHVEKEAIFTEDGMMMISQRDWDRIKKEAD